MHCVSVHTNIWIGCCVRALVHDESTKLPNDSHPVYTHPYMSAPVITTFTGGPPLSPPRSHTHRSPPGSAGLPVEVRGHRRRINDKKARDRAAPPGGPAGRGCSDVSPPPQCSHLRSDVRKILYANSCMARCMGAGHCIYNYTTAQ